MHTNMHTVAVWDAGQAVLLRSGCGCVITASNAWPVMLMTLNLRLWHVQFVINDRATVTGDRLMIVPTGWLG